MTALVIFLPTFLLFALVYRVGYEHGRSFEIGAQVKRIEALLERIGVKL